MSISIEGGRKGEGSPEPAPSRGTCFTIMPFGGWFDRYYQDVFKPAIQAVGLVPRRADDLYRPSTIVNDIWAHTKACTLVLADLTGKNPNVFYELGLAHALGKPAILVTEDLSDVPFDLRALRVISYDKNDSSWGEVLRAKLEIAIEEVLQAPKSAVLPTFLEVDATSERPTVSRAEKKFLELQKDLDLIKKELAVEATGSGALDDFPFLAQMRELIVIRIKSGVPLSNIIKELKDQGVQENWARAEVAEVTNIIASGQLGAKHTGTKNSNRVLMSVYALEHEREEALRAMGSTEAIALRLNAQTGADLLRAAAVKLGFVDNQWTFSRDDLLKEMRSAKTLFRKGYASNLTGYLQKMVNDEILERRLGGFYCLSAAEKRRLTRP